MFDPEEIPENQSEQKNISDDGGDFSDVATEIIGGIIDIAAGIISDD